MLEKLHKQRILIRPDKGSYLLNEGLIGCVISLKFIEPGRDIIQKSVLRQVIQVLHLVLGRRNERVLLPGLS